MFFLIHAFVVVVMYIVCKNMKVIEWTCASICLLKNDMRACVCGRGHGTLDENNFVSVNSINNPPPLKIILKRSCLVGLSGKRITKS